MSVEILKQESKKTTHPYNIFFTFGLGKERDYFVENLSMLISGGMPIMTALSAISTEMRTRRMKNIITNIKLSIESGSSLWQTLKESNIFPEHAISLIRLGEESGNLAGALSDI